MARSDDGAVLPMTCWRKSMFTMFAGGPGWTVSEFAELPVIPPHAEASLRDDYLIAGGLALVLSRCPPQITRRRFRATLQVYQALKQRRRAGLSRELISDASHEVAEFTDQATRDALRRRMQCPLR
jgi:hypothetical protein